jgi:dynactin-4
VGIKDANASNGPWPEHDSVFNARIDQLYDHFKALASRDKQLLRGGKRVIPQLKPMSASGHALHLLDKYGISSSLSPKVTQALREKSKGSVSSPNLQGMQSGKDSRMSTSGLEIRPSEAKENLDDEDDFDEDTLYNKELDVSSVSTLEQRLRQMETQPKSVKAFLPVPQMLSIKRSLRCKTCDHNLSKPEFNPSSIKFKILLAAYYHVPEIKVREWSMEDKWIDLSIQNPTPYDLHVVLDTSHNGKEGSLHLDNFTAVKLVIPPKDDTLDIDLDLGTGVKKEPEEEQDKRIIGRKGNKAFVLLRFNPKNNGTEGDQDAKIGSLQSRVKMLFTLRHDFVNTIVQVSGSEKRETQIQSVSHEITITLPSSVALC